MKLALESSADAGANLRHGFICRRLTGELIVIGEPLGDNLVNFRRKTKTNMSGSHFDVLDIGSVLIDASLPSDDRIRARVNRRHGCAERNLITQFDFGFNRCHVDAAAAKPASDNGILGTADDRRAESDHSMHQIGSFAGRLSSQVSSQTPADESDLLLGFPPKRTDTFYYARHQIRHIAMISSETPAADPVTQQAKIAFEDRSRAISRAVSGEQQNRLALPPRLAGEISKSQHESR